MGPILSAIKPQHTRPTAPASIAMTRLLTPALGDPHTALMKLAMCTIGTPMHMQQRNAAKARMATVPVRALDGAAVPAEKGIGALVPSGHLSTGKASASAAQSVPPTPTKAHRQPTALIRKLAKYGSRPCPSAPPAVTSPVTNPRCFGNHSPLVESSGE